MYYRLVQEIDGEHFGRSEHSPMVFEYEKPNVTVCIRVHGEEDKPVIIETVITKIPKAKIEKVFKNLEEGFYSNKENTKGLVEDLKAKLKSINKGSYGYSLPYDIFPEYFRSYCSDIRNTIFSFSSRTYKTIRWVDGIEGSNHPFKNTKLQWSFDNSKWNDFPGRLSADLKIKGGLFSTPSFIERVRGIVQAGESEPLAHELLREAYSIKTQYPRSSILISVSAAEAGIKKCITSFNPETSWLIENTASPDIVKLYRDYIHSELIKETEYKLLKLPKNTVMEPLRKIIQMRNIIAHGGVCNIDQDNLVESLHMIGNLLWIIDVFMGNKWAIRHIDDEIKLEMGIECHI